MRYIPVARCCDCPNRDRGRCVTLERPVCGSEDFPDWCPLESLSRRRFLRGDALQLPDEGEDIPGPKVAIW